jgi:hypothetical protein
MMRRFFGTIWSSSQPTIKVEGGESEESVVGEFVVLVLCWKEGLWIGLIAWQKRGRGWMKLWRRGSRMGLGMRMWIWRI